ncbi:Polysaccharide biosynthesis protein [uncultured archaeon]|nr:Polysaccharide biosynthesis protein [uncultured archaeon]
MDIRKLYGSETLLKNAIISRSFADQLPRNLFANIAYFLVSVVIGILLVPYFVSNLGIASYGLIPLVTSITGYVAIVVQSLNIVVSRFLTVDLQRKDYVAANRTFNTALFGFTAIILLLAPIVLAVSWFIPSIFHVPVGQKSDAALLFLGVCTAFLISSWTGNFTVQLFAYNRLDFQNLINLVKLLVQTGMTVLFFALFGPNLALLGSAYLIAAVIASSISIILSRQVCPYLILSLRSFDRRIVKDLCEMWGWVIISQVGALLFLSIDLIVVNLLFGATSAGNYSIALQWSIALRAIGGVLSGVLTPMILSYYAHEQTDSLIQVSKSAVKLMGFALALPVGLICGLAPQLLLIWVGSEFINLAHLMVLLTISLSINLAVLPLLSINVAYNQVRVPGIVTLVMGVWNIALAVALSLQTDWGYYGVAIAGTIVLTTKNAFFTPWYSTKVLGVDVHTFTWPMLLGVVATIIVSISAAILGAVLPFEVLTMLIVACISVTIAYVTVVWSFGLNEFERKLFKSYMPSKLRRIIA